VLCPEGGQIYVDILKKQFEREGSCYGWSPALSIPKAVLLIQSPLTKEYLTDPNPHQPLNHEAQAMLLCDSDEYNRTVQEWVKLYATPYGRFCCCVVHFALLPPKAAQLRAIHLVFHAASACPIFGPRSVRAHYLQPRKQRSLEHAQELLCRDNKQRAQLMCCSCPLSTLARRLDNSGEWMGSIMRRCFSIFASRPLHQPHRS
jgi:hypothetical protein